MIPGIDMYLQKTSLVCLFTLLLHTCFAQSTAKAGNEKPLVYVDKKGVLRYTADNKEAAFFGTNYTVPFAYGYRSHKVLNTDIKKAMEQDVYHMARLGLDAFRVHIWDTEISDTAGNLLANDHLALFDYLVYLLEQRNIKITITPLAFWGNGYPEKDEHTAGFSAVWDKKHVLVTEAAIKAQENYLQQLLKHVNPYTSRTYTADRNIIMLEVNNEPFHSGPRDKVTEYINRMVKAVRSAGWEKPIFYNINESPTYAGAVAQANVSGFSFQWYPTGLVANHTLQGNYLPNVDKYRIPFTDSIPQLEGKARMVYEFDAGDVLQSVMYPAIARSFRAAGFQWATHFAYDPMATAFANTEYQTHYMNLAYTPSKAISLLIAGKAFRTLPRFQQYDTYPKDSSFAGFRTSYACQLSEMNTAEEFYYSNTTQTQPSSSNTLQHIAGVGSSPVVTYNGTGAYFLDKIAEGIWRLEIMPDAVTISDPFAKASLSKEVTRILWNNQQMQLHLPVIGDQFTVTAVNNGNSYTTQAQAATFIIKPGTYLIAAPGKSTSSYNAESKAGILGMQEFAAPAGINASPLVIHTPAREVTANTAFTINARVTGVNENDKVTLYINRVNGAWKHMDMQRTDPTTYIAVVPADIVTPGILNYTIAVQKAGNSYYNFPGNYTGNPFAWDYYHNDSYTTLVAAPGSALELFNAATDKHMFAYPNWSENGKTTDFITGSTTGTMLYSIFSQEPADKQPAIGWQLYVGDKLQPRQSELNGYNTLHIRAKAVYNQPAEVKVLLISRQSEAWSATVTVNNTIRDYTIPLSSFRKDSMLIMPRPYPSFQALWFNANNQNNFHLQEVEKIEVVMKQQPGGTGVSVETITLQP